LFLLFFSAPPADTGAPQIRRQNRKIKKGFAGKSPLPPLFCQLIRWIHFTANHVSSQTTMLHKLHTFLTISLRILPKDETFFQVLSEHIAQNAHRQRPVGIRI
jgi:hypothetical protein